MTTYIEEDFKNINIDHHPDEKEKLIGNFHRTIGYDAENECHLPSSYLSSGTWEQILGETTNVVYSYRKGNVECVRDHVHNWNMNIGDIHVNDKPLVDDLPGLMSDIKQLCKGINIAICTSDNRRATNACIKNWNIEEYIDVSHDSKKFIGIDLLISTHALF